MDRTVGPYELIKRIAVGGAAEIYLARKSGLLGFEQHYALKVLLPHHQEDSEQRKMMVDEARLTAQLDHPNIIKVHDLGEEDGTLFMVMEHVNGLSLAQVMLRLQKQGKQMPVDVAAYIAREACGGLQYAHTRSSVDGSDLHLVHRDVSPQNVLVGFGGEVKLIDFGVAKANVGGRLETKTGIIKGKLTYMAPEYAIGSQQDNRSDIFATGLVLYEMVTGRAAYDIEDARELVESVKKAQIQRPSKFRDDVPPELEQVLERALEQRPDDRWASAGEMQTALTQFLSAFAPDFRKERLAEWMATLQPPTLDEASDADTDPELPDVPAGLDPDASIDVAETGPATVERPTESGPPAGGDDSAADESGPPTMEYGDRTPGTHATLAGRPVTTEEPDMDALVATQAMDMEERGLRPKQDPSQRKTTTGMPGEEDEAGKSGKQSRAELLAGIKLPPKKRDTMPANVLEVDKPGPEDDATDVLGPDVDVPPLADSDAPTLANTDFPKIRREIAENDIVATAPTEALDVATIAPERTPTPAAPASSSSELPTAMNIDVDTIRGDQSGAGPTPDQSAISGPVPAAPGPHTGDQPPRLHAPVVDDGSSQESLPAVIVEAQQGPPPPLEKRTPGLTPPDPDPDASQTRLSDSATALIGKMSERYDEYSKTESGRKTTDAIIVAVLGLALLFVLTYIFFFPN